MNTSSGAEWAYFMDAYGPAPAFLFSWVSTLVLKPSQMAIICLSFAQYAVEAFVTECDPPRGVVKMVALVAIASREGHLLDILSYVHVRRLTPAPGLIFHSLIASAMVLHGTIDSLIDFFSFTAWIFYGGAMLALIVMRYTKPNHPRPYKVPIVIPVVVLIISVYLVAAPIFQTPRIEYLYALLFIFAGLIFYVPFVKLGMTPRFMNKVTLFFQLLLEVVPTSSMAMFE
ncbi:b(0,+)-type amino acid transporter 1-like isoform X2 [Drosophila montana]